MYSITYVVPPKEAMSSKMVRLAFVYVEQPNKLFMMDIDGNDTPMTRKELGDFMTNNLIIKLELPVAIDPRLYAPHADDQGRVWLLYLNNPTRFGSSPYLGKITFI